MGNAAGKRAELPAIGGPGQTEISMAIRAKNIQAVEALIARGVNLNEQTNDGTPLTLAAMIGFAPIVNLLLEKGADINSKDKGGNTALILASFYGKLDIVILLINKGANLNIRNLYGSTALLRACEESYEDVANLLMDKGADVNIQNYSRDTALIVATRVNNGILINNLLNKGADINARGFGEITPLMTAVNNKLRLAVEQLLARGADINLQDSSGNTALILAAASGSSAIAKILVDAGANLNIQTSDGDTALMIASLYERLRIVELLVERGADMTIRNQDGQSATDLARSDEIGALLGRRALPPVQQIAADTPSAFDSDPYPAYATEINVGELPVKAQPYGKDTKAFDTIAQEDVLLDEVITNPESILIKLGDKYEVYNLEFLKQSIENGGGIFYACNKSLGGTALPADIYGKNPLFLFRGSAMFYVLLAEVQSLLAKPEVRAIELTPGEVEFATTASIKNVMKELGKNYYNEAINIVSGDHCQSGSNKKLYKITILNLEKQAGGRRKRTHRKKKQARRARKSLRRDMLVR